MLCDKQVVRLLVNNTPVHHNTVQHRDISQGYELSAGSYRVYVIMSRLYHQAHNLLASSIDYLSKVPMLQYIKRR